MMKKLLKKCFLLMMLISCSFSFAQTWTTTQVPSKIKVDGSPSATASPNTYIVVGKDIPVTTSRSVYVQLMKNDETTVFGSVVITLAADAAHGAPTVTVNRTLVSQTSVLNDHGTPGDLSDDTYTHTFVFNSFNTFGTAIVYDEVAKLIIADGLAKDIVPVTVESAPASIIQIMSIGTPPTEIERGREFTVNFKYKSNVAITSMKINLWVVSGTPYKDKFLGATDYITTLPSTNGLEVDASAKIRFPVAATIDNVSGTPSVTTTFTLNNPPTASTATATVYYQLRFRLEGAPIAPLTTATVTGQTFADVSNVQKSFANVVIVGTGGIVEKDADDDGVIDANDTCPSTTYGAVVNASGCSDVQLSTANFALPQGSFYPNPATNEIKISESVKTKTYKVASLTGAIVLEANATGTLDISSLTSGLYLLITDAGVAKFVKE